MAEKKVINLKFEEIKCPTCQKEMRQANVQLGHVAVIGKHCDDCNQSVVLVVPNAGEKAKIEITPQ